MAPRLLVASPFFLTMRMGRISRALLLTPWVPPRSLVGGVAAIRILEVDRGCWTSKRPRVQGRCQMDSGCWTSKRPRFHSLREFTLHVHSSIRGIHWTGEISSSWTPLTHHYISFPLLRNNSNIKACIFFFPPVANKNTQYRYVRYG